MNRKTRLKSLKKSTNANLYEQKGVIETWNLWSMWDFAFSKCLKSTGLVDILSLYSILSQCSKVIEVATRPDYCTMTMTCQKTEQNESKDSFKFFDINSNH